MSEREIRMARHLTEDQVAALITAVEQFADLMDDSTGVAGLHLNGDLAEWDWLLDDHLSGFADAHAPIKALHDSRMIELEIAKNAAFSKLQEDDGYDDRPEWELRTGYREEDFP